MAVVDIRWVLAGRDIVDFVVDGVTFKRDEPADEPADCLVVFCDRTELALDIDEFPTWQSSHYSHDMS